MRVAILFAIRYNTFERFMRLFEISRIGTNRNKEITWKYGALSINICARSVRGVIR